MHGATTVADPEGHLRLRIVDVEEAVRYRFGLKTADFLVCGKCGVYVAAVLTSEAGAVATLNVNVLHEREAFSAAPQRVDYEGESSRDRQLRRARRWTITTILVGTQE